MKGLSLLYRWAKRLHWSKAKVVHCGLEPAFQTLKTTFPPVMPRLVCVGGLYGKRGQLLLVETPHCLARKDLMFELVLGRDGELRAQVEALIAKRSAAHMVKKVAGQFDSIFSTRAHCVRVTAKKKVVE